MLVLGDCSSCLGDSGILIRLLSLGATSVKFIEPTRCAEWIANIVLVVKNNEKIMVYIDFKDLTEVTSKDEYPILVAKMLLDAAANLKSYL